jgi:hypothetical protein
VDVLRKAANAFDTSRMFYSNEGLDESWNTFLYTVLTACTPVHVDLTWILVIPAFTKCGSTICVRCKKITENNVKCSIFKQFIVVVFVINLLVIIPSSTQLFTISCCLFWFVIFYCVIFRPTLFKNRVKTLQFTGSENSYLHRC